MKQADDGTWRPWADSACEALGLEPEAVDLTTVLGIAARVADFKRPMAPVATYLVGVAVGRGMPVDEAVAAVFGTVTEKA